ncbi:MAG: response regulator [Flavobacterium sp.]|nr:MAG: response regulator [Flavobacterium sp.]
MKQVVLSINALRAMNYLLQTVITPKHSIVLVHDAMEGMHVLRNKTSVDVVIIDLDYDTQDNLELIHYLKSSRLYSACKVIVLCSAVNMTLSETDKNNIDRFFSKPFGPVQLIDYINTLSMQKSSIRS